MVDRAELKMARELVWKVKCPVCKARKGQPCRWFGKLRPISHLARIERFAGCGFEVPVSTPVRRTAAEREAYRAERRSVPCPLCGAQPGERCLSRRPEGRLSNHTERNMAWQRAQA